MREFYENVKHKFKYGAHNLYELTSVDMDGNVVDRKFGINVLTNEGFRRYYGTGNSYESTVAIYIGDGTGTPSVTDTTMFHQTITAGGTGVNPDGSQVYYNHPNGNGESGSSQPPLIYDSTTGLITGFYCFNSFRWDYNYSGINDPVPVTEIGMGGAVTALTVHSLVYDSEGNIASITKNPNERLFIKVYFAVNISESIIQTNYENGIYLMFDPAYFARNTLDARVALSVGYYRTRTDNSDQILMSNWDYIYTYYSLLPDSTEDRRVTITPAAVTYEGKRHYIDTVCLWGSNWAVRSGGDVMFAMFTLDRLTTPEELTTDTFFTNSVTSLYFTNSFGRVYNADSHSGEFPVVDFNMTSLKMYNRLTNEWDIDESFLNAPDTDYTDPSRFSSNIVVSLNGSRRTLYVHVNPFASRYKITKFGVTGVVLYATDKYWDTTSYEVIPNLADVPLTLQQKRYYVCTTSATLYPTYDYTLHQLTDVADVGTLNKIINVNNGLTYLRGDTPRRVYSDDTRGFIHMGRSLFYPFETGCPVVELPQLPANPDDWRPSYSDDVANGFFTNNGDTFIWRGQYYVNGNRRYFAKKYRIYDMTTSSPSGPPSYYDFELDDPRFSFNCWTSVNDQGIMVVADYEGNDYKAFIVDLNNLDENDQPTQHTITYAKWCQAVECTTNYVYLDPRDNYFRIKTVANDTLVAEFQLPQDQGITVNGFDAWKNKVMIWGTANSIQYLYTYDIQTETLNAYPNMDVRGLGRENIDRSWRVLKYACDDFVIIGSGKTDDGLNINYPTIMFDNNLFSDTPHVFNFKGLYHLQVKEINNKQLIAIMYTADYVDAWTNNARTSVVDLGYLMNNGVENTSQYGINRLSSYRDQYSNAVIVGDQVVLIPSETANVRTAPYQTLMCHKTTGTTNTIQAYNNPKRISNKTMSITLTNNLSKHSLD